MNKSIEIILPLALGTLLLLVTGLFIVLLVRQLLRRSTLHALEKAALQNTFENQLLQSRLETQEQSFQYFSEEIHDNVGQVLSVVGMHLYQLEAECSGEHAQQLARQGSVLLNKAIEDLRSISHTLNGNYLTKAGLIETLQQEIGYINSVKEAHCRIEVNGEPEELSPDRQTLLYRMIQEAIKNALKHAGASEITIGLQYSDGMLTASVADNGRGFKTNAGEGANAGLGLTNMQLRADLLKGRLLIESRPGSGTRLFITIHIHSA